MTKKADLLLHPVRMRILQHLLLGTPLTIAQLTEALGDVPQATLYRHVNLLLKAELIEVADTKKVKGTEERLFLAREDNLKIPEHEIETTSIEDHIRYFSVFHSNLLQLATTYLSNTPPDKYKEEGFGYWSTPIHVSDGEFVELFQSINQCLEKVLDNQPSAERKTRIFAGMFIPQNSGPV
ncbi:helix-turn-helix domain-containing protein [Paenibacillus sp. D2_2]|uniref:helix-turn-helix domain-containing protein n=1 Tax=Paenibacillus sp. D2_2 TaxID=3073092 RepID=UPI0028154B11|nr:helix-turn-helix domain-containing protein [Paenibacillus sp. D2_2]WMT39370.1 helix-turn-helix domain-containing protein [Paenibacillus sp. D2_2]